MANKRIEVKNEDECKMCELYNSCVGVRAKESGSILVIENSGKRYRICKPEQYDVAVEDKRNSLSERTCFMCKRNLTWWKSNDGMAHCGAYYSMGVPQKTPPDSAKRAMDLSRNNKEKTASKKQEWYLKLNFVPVEDYVKEDKCLCAKNRIGQKCTGRVRIFHLNRLLAWYGSETVPPTDTASKPSHFISCSLVLLS